MTWFLTNINHRLIRTKMHFVILVFVYYIGIEHKNIDKK